MPVSGIYTWRETEKLVILSIPLKGTSRKDLDVYLARTHVKISYLPYLIELDLLAEVDEAESSGQVKDATLTIRLAKEEAKLWGCLLFQSDKKTISERRKRGSFEHMEAKKLRHQETKDMRLQEEKNMIRAQMTLEENERKIIDDKKNQEKQIAETNLYKSIAAMKFETENKGAKIAEARAIDVSNTKVDNCDGNNDHNNRSIIGNANKNETRPSSANSSATISACIIPPPRSQLKVSFKHTQRIFKTAARQSTAKQERKFLMAQQSTSRHMNSNCMLENKDAVDIADADAGWLKRRGDACASGGDFVSAINAYSAAFERDKSMVTVVANRAACFFASKRYDRCQEDCTLALKLLLSDNVAFQPQKMETTLLRRRSAAKKHLHDLTGALNDLVAARATIASKLATKEDSEIEEIDLEINALQRMILDDMYVEKSDKDER